VRDSANPRRAGLGEEADINAEGFEGFGGEDFNWACPSPAKRIAWLRLPSYFNGLVNSQIPGVK
jgi:hypothetical protein